MTTYTGDGSDNVFTGGADSDQASGEGGNDTLSGLGGNDRLEGGDGDDALNGGDNNDVLIGGAGADSLTGGNGDDILFSHFLDPNMIGYLSDRPTVHDTFAERDSLHGGDGDDYIHAGYGDTVDGGTYSAFGNRLYISFLASPTGVQADFRPLQSGGTVTIGGATISNIQTIGFLEGSDYDDLLVPIDTFYPTGANVYGRGGNDHIIADYYSGWGGSGLYGDAGNDIIDARGAQYGPRLFGGAGNDTLYTNPNALAIAYGDEGNDTIHANFAYGGSGDDRIFARFGGGTAYGEDGNDVIRGDVYGDRAFGGEGNDTIYGYGESDSGFNDDDTLNGDAGLDFLYGGTGNDTLDGGADADALYGDAGNDSLHGGGGDDVINGGDGNDSGYGGDGNDLLNSGSGTDQLTGEAGDDTIFFGAHFGAGDLAAGGDGAGDVLVLQGNYGELSASAANIAGIESIRLLGAADSTFGGQGAGPFSYVITLVDNVVAAGATLTVDGSGLAAGESLTLSGASETNGRYVLLGGADADRLTAGAGDDQLDGGQGDDLLDGGAGADVMTGGLGADIFIVDQAGDQVVELAGQGIDEVRTSLASYTLGAHLENLTGTSASGQALTGNGLANLISGGAGADTMAGKGGNDTYVVNHAGDVVLENAGEGSDAVLSSVSFTLGAGIENLTLIGSGAINGAGNALANIVTGNAAANVLNGGGGDDRLDGGAGADTMRGDAGNDTYVVDHVDDRALEGVGAGTDSVLSAVTFTLTANVENLTLTGVAAINGTGNGLANRLTGNGAANRLDGRTGADVMAGLAGDDTYVVDHVGDSIDEAAGEGLDTVLSDIAYTLGANLENLALTGTSAINGTGNGLDNVIVGNGAANVLRGGAGIDTLEGGAGNDTLDGGTGADDLSGGGGNDTYLVDDAGDRVVETAAGDGKDLVRSSVSFTLGAHLEKLTLTGTGAIDGTGNGLSNFIVGNAAANVLDGAAGADSLAGGAGDDTYIVDNVGDRVSENANEGTDTVRSSVSFSLTANVEDLTLTGTGAINGAGNTLFNTITGNSAANVINGGGGADTLIGGDGNDIYIVDHVGDLVAEQADEGVDLVKSTVSHTLRVNVEKLTLRGSEAIDGTGNALANTIAGNEAANRLDGAAGADKLLGYGGDDTYVVDHVADQVIETSSGGGSDTVLASVTFTLGDHVESLWLTGADAIDGTGNALDNFILGNGAANILDGGRGSDALSAGAGDDTLIGGLGLDSLEGGAGADRFVFDKALSAGNADMILDFAAGSDTIVLENAVFKGIAAGALNGNALAIGSAAADADDRIVYDPSTGSLYYDADGTGTAAQILFATLDNPPPTLAASDFAVI